MFLLSFVFNGLDRRNEQIFQLVSYKYVYFSARTVFTYLTARFTAVSKIKCPLSGAKTLVQYLNTGMFLLG